ncbi:MAG: hypothetical protein RLY31_1265 [Bacteroidota bacterium]|jgi:hypothetical protein
MKLTDTHPFPKACAWLAGFLLSAFVGLPGSDAGAQSCTYTIQLLDSFGDGWNGGVLTVTSAGEVTTHTLPTGSSGTSTFQVTNGEPIVISWTAGSFAFEPSFNLLDADGTLIFSVGNPIPAGVVFDGIGVCPNCPIPNPDLVIISQVTDSTAFVNWLSVPEAEHYFVEYGPAGFPFGHGIQLDMTASQVTLEGLNPCLAYEVYLAVYCGVDSTSSYIGPYTFETSCTPATPGDTCTYTLELYDSFGDGWNGSSLTVTHNGTSTAYTMPGGSAITHTFDAISNLPITFTFSPGSFLNETSYDIIDPNGTVIFSDGPFPQTGEVFTTIACPTCPGPLAAWMSDINATTATVSWLPAADADPSFEYIVEYGPIGFTLGTGLSDTLPGGSTSALLTGLMENSWYNVYVKLDCGTEYSRWVGPLFFHTIWLRDIGVSTIIAPNPDVSCDLTDNEVVTIGLTNYGQLPQTLFEFYFAVNGQPAPVSVPQDGLFTGVVGNDSTQYISFETTWDFSQPGYYLIEAWTQMEGDSNVHNDTFRLEISTAFPKPLVEDFEDNAIPPGWTNSGFLYAPNAHNNPTYVAAANLYSFNPNFTINTYRFGPIVEGDSLYFDYRYVNWSAGTVATNIGANDKLFILVSDDCEETYDTVHVVDNTNHIVSNVLATKAVSLENYVGKAINIRFSAVWGAGDYWLDIDNINVPGCPESLQLVGAVTNSLEGDSTGGVNLTAYLSQGDLQVVWINAVGDTVSTMEDPTGLPTGTYYAYVTDGNGCQDSKSFEVGTLVSTQSAVSDVATVRLYPNPARTAAFLEVALPDSRDVLVRLFDTQGVVLLESTRRGVDHFVEAFDLHQYAPGMYIVQVLADGRPHYTRLVIAR